MASAVSAVGPSSVQSKADDLPWEDILKALPKEVYERSTAKGVGSLLLSLALVVAGMYLLVVLPPFALPLGWFFVGTVYAGLSSVGYDCSTGGFSKYGVLNQVVGHIVCLPLCFPFETWRLQLNQLASQGLPALPAIQGPLWWLSSGYQWVRSNFMIGSVFLSGNRRRIVASLVLLYVFQMTFFPLMLYNLGIWGLVKYWFIPWLVYHFWMSTFAATSTVMCKIPFLENTSVRFTICKYPKWVEFLTRDMNYVMTAARNVTTSIAHHPTIAVPSYNLKNYYNSLNRHWEEVHFGWDTVRQLVNQIGQGLSMVNWPTATFLVVCPFIALWGIFTTTLTLPTAIWAIITYQIAGLGITVGYHRMWSHRAFSACRAFEYAFCYAGTSAFQGSILWWCRDHRAHHRFTDTPKDPYDITKGFWWAHMGWLLVEQDQEKIGKTDTSDLEADPLVMFQDRHYIPLAFLTGWIIPTMVAGIFWGDWWGGFYYACVLRSVIVLQATFCINSVAHWVGAHTFSDDRTPRDSWWVSLITFGEGYHNFHHEFPYDYRNGVFWYAYDPSKWVVYALSLFGITYDLKRFPDNEIIKGQLQMLEKNINSKKATLKWGPSRDKLPVYSMEEVEKRAGEGAKLMAIDGLVYDLAGFSHPGGESFIKIKLGKDASEAFNGGVYKHSNGARNLMAHMLVGKLKEKTR